MFEGWRWSGVHRRFRSNFHTHLSKMGFAFVALALALSVAVVDGKCNMNTSTNKYPPSADMALPWHDINLDLDPKVQARESTYP